MAGSYPRAYLRDVAAAIRFFSRLPLPSLHAAGADDGHALPGAAALARGLPVAGLVIGLPGALVLWGALTLGLPPLAAAALALAAGMVSTGALHEDGLSDTADGLGGGATPEKRLAIMRDSRIGAYGACALGISLLLRAALLADLAMRGSGFDAALALLAAASLSRVMGLAPLAFLPPARPDGLSAAVGPLPRASLAVAFAVALGLALLAAAAGGIRLGGLIAGLVIALSAVGWLIRRAKAALGGQTGDIAGAAQQVAEIGLLMGFSIGMTGL